MIAQIRGVLTVFYDNYLRLCNSVGKTPSAVALEIGLTKPSVSRWKSGSMPTDATLKRIADYFGITVDELLGKEKQPTDGELSDEEKAMLDLFRQAGDDARRLALLALEHGEQK
jgi:transcriptional regulator with XRE-family HTH domain